MISKIKHKLTLKSDTKTGLNCRSNQWLLNFIYRQFKMLFIGTNSLMKQSFFSLSNQFTKLSQEFKLKKLILKT